MTGVPRLHLITDDGVLADPDFPEMADRVLECCGRGAALHLRGHGTSGARLHALGEQLEAATLRTGAWLIVNDRVDVARAVRANGVQLGERSLPVADARALLGAGARIGCSVHGAAEALQAETDGADFVVLGTIYRSATHPDAGAAGVDLVHRTSARTTIPVIAIGGITPARAAEVAAAGAAGIAVLGGVWRARDAVAAATEYAQCVREVWSAAGRTS
ncbi:MAG TPA: thiamine phosphate synthase [Longimicrobiales bacterium]